MAAACGGDDSGAQAPCVGAACDDASSDAPSDFDVTPAKDASGDRDSASPSSCSGLASGALDPSFGTGGKAFAPLSAGFAAAVQPDGKILLAGSAASAENGSFAVARLDPDGSIDSSFGGGTGRAEIDFEGESVANAVALQGDGKIVLAGAASSNDAGGQQIAIVRLDVDGSPDATFGNGGKAVIDYGQGINIAFGVAVKPTGEIVVVGTEGYNGVVIGQLTSSGVLDTSFRPDAGSLPPFGFAAYAVRIEGSKIYVAGSGFGASDSDGFITRLNADGIVDPTYGPGGAAYPSTNDDAIGMAPTGAGGYDLLVRRTELVDVDGSATFEGAFGVARFTASGTLDPSFGIGGKISGPFSRTTTLGGGIAPASGDRTTIAIPGVVGSDPSASDFVIHRYDGDGGEDQTFGDAGSVVTAFPPYFAVPTSLVRQTDGRWIAAGYGVAVLPDGGVGAAVEVARYCP